MLVPHAATQTDNIGGAAAPTARTRLGRGGHALGTRKCSSCYDNLKSEVVPCPRPIPVAESASVRLAAPGLDAGPRGRIFLYFSC